MRPKIVFQSDSWGDGECLIQMSYWDQDDPKEIDDKLDRRVRKLLKPIEKEYSGEGSKAICFDSGAAESLMTIEGNDCSISDLIPVAQKIWDLLKADGWDHSDDPTDGWLDDVVALNYDETKKESKMAFKTEDCVALLVKNHPGTVAADWKRRKKKDVSGVITRIFQNTKDDSFCVILERNESLEEMAFEDTKAAYDGPQAYYHISDDTDLNMSTPNGYYVTVSTKEYFDQFHYVDDQGGIPEFMEDEFHRLGIAAYELMESVLEFAAGVSKKQAEDALASSPVFIKSKAFSALIESQDRSLRRWGLGWAS